MNGPCEDRDLREAWESLSHLLQRSSPRIDSSDFARRVAASLDRRRRRRWAVRSAAVVAACSAAVILVVFWSPQPKGSAPTFSQTAPLPHQPEALVWNDDFDEQVSSWRQDARSAAKAWQSEPTSFDFVARDMQALQGDLERNSL
jgi:hypothetical protein